MDLAVNIAAGRFVECKRFRLAIIARPLTTT